MYYQCKRGREFVKIGIIRGFERDTFTTYGKMNPDFTLFGLCLTSTLKKIAKISCLQLMKEFQIRFNHKAKRSNAKKFNFRRLPKSSPLNCWVEISYCL